MKFKPNDKVVCIYSDRGNIGKTFTVKEYKEDYWKDFPPMRDRLINKNNVDAVVLLEIPNGYIQAAKLRRKSPTYSDLLEKI